MPLFFVEASYIYPLNQNLYIVYKLWLIILKLPVRIINISTLSLINYVHIQLWPSRYMQSVRSECGMLRAPVGLGHQRLKNWHLLLPWLAFSPFQG